MEHSSHAHPLPNGWSTKPPQASPPAQITSSVASPRNRSSTTLQQQHPEALNPQARRLQLRNVGFKAPSFPARRISPLFGVSSQAIDQSPAQISKENTPMSAEKRSTYGENLPPSPVNILQEIHNSTRRKRPSSRPGMATIFQDTTPIKDVDDDGATSWYNEASNNCSPAQFSPSPAVMKLREGSLNEKTPPPLSSSLAKHVTGRSGNRQEPRAISLEAAQHIEYLEAQLASVQAKVDSLTSPTTKNLRSAKMRALTIENRSLRLQNAEWERKHEERFQEEKEKRLEFKAELTTQLRNLEEDISMREARIAELEWEVESMRVKTRDAEGLEEINIGLERRIDMLSKLLVESPTRQDAQSAAPSFKKADSIRRTPRPKSMLSRWASSPGGVRLSGALGTDTAFWQYESFDSMGIQESAEEAMQIEEDHEPFQSPSSEEGLKSPISPRQSRRSGFFEPRSRTSTSMRSAPSSSSRPTSFMSASSNGAASWGLPLPAENDAKACNRRRMRKFPSGSNSLKPLILPTATTIPSLPASAPVYPSIQTTAEQDLSEISIDPTTMFLSGQMDASPTSTTPLNVADRNSTQWAHEQTMKALEGNSGASDAYGGTENTLAPRPTSPEPQPRSRTPSFDERLTRRLRPKSLHRELEQAKRARTGLGITDAVSPDPFQDRLIPLSGDLIPETGRILIGMDTTPSKAPLPDSFLRSRRHLAESDITPKPPKIPPTTSPTQLYKSPSSTTLTPAHAHGIFSRLTSLISQTKREPLDLAKRLLANAWLIGSARLGGVGWWLLGPVYHHRKRERDADTAIVQDSRTPGFLNWFRGRTDESQALLAQSSTAHPRSDNIWPPIWASQHPHLFPCPTCVEPTSRRTFRLWLHFSLTIVLAVGIALKHGPGTLLAELPAHSSPPRSRISAEDEERQCQRSRLEARGLTDRRAISGSTEGGEGSERDSGYGSVIFAETLGPKDFEGRGL